MEIEQKTGLSSHLTTQILKLFSTENLTPVNKKKRRAKIKRILNLLSIVFMQITLWVVLYLITTVLLKGIAN